MPISLALGSINYSTALPACGGGGCLALPSILRLGPLPGPSVTAPGADTPVSTTPPSRQILTGVPRVKRSATGIWRMPGLGDHAGVSLGYCCCLHNPLGHLPELESQPTSGHQRLRPLWASPGTPVQAQAHHYPLYTQAHSPPHSRFQNSLFADIYSALPQPGSLLRPGQCSGKGGSLPATGWGVLCPFPSAWCPMAATVWFPHSPSTPTTPGPQPPPQQQPGVGGWGRRARRPPPPAPRRAGGLWGAQRTKHGSSPAPPPGPGKWGRSVEALPSGARESCAEQPVGGGRATDPASRPHLGPPPSPPPQCSRPRPQRSRSGRGRRELRLGAPGARRRRRRDGGGGLGVRDGGAAAQAPRTPGSTHPSPAGSQQRRQQRRRRLRGPRGPRRGDAGVRRSLSPHPGLRRRRLRRAPGIAGGAAPARPRSPPPAPTSTPSRGPGAAARLHPGVAVGGRRADCSGEGPRGACGGCEGEARARRLEVPAPAGLGRLRPPPRPHRAPSPPPPAGLRSDRSLGPPPLRASRVCSQTCV